MVAFNSTDHPVTLSTTRYYERMKGYNTGTNLATGEVLSDLSSLIIDKNSTIVLELGH
jgi:hypothetical protein